MKSLERPPDREVLDLGQVGYPMDLATGDLDGDGIADVVGVTAAAISHGGEIFVLRSGS